MTAPTFDYTPLTSPPSTEQRQRARKKLIRTNGGAVIIPVLLLLLFLAVAMANNHYDMVVIPVEYIFILLMVGFVGSVLYLVNLFKQFVNIERLQAFTEANDMLFEQHIDSPTYPGLVFTVGHDQRIDVSIGTYRFGNPVELGNYRYVTGSGKSRALHLVGYVRIKLPRKLPHMILDAQSNNFTRFFSSLPATFDRSQTLSLEGNFDKYFTLYAPKQYETDALYVFTPDVMNMLINHVSDYDVEIIDDELYLYTQKHFDLANDATLQKLFTLAATISPEFHHQTDYYADEKVGNRQANIIAPGGQRLKKGVSWTAIALGVLYFLISFADKADVLFQDGKGVIVGIFVVITLLGVTISLLRRKH